MNIRHFLRYAVCLGMALLLAACGGGDSSKDVTPVTGSATPPVAALVGPDSFLIFPNPQVQTDGSSQTLSTTYADSYYAEIDPTNARDTFAKWKAVNNFDTGIGTQLLVVFGDVRDLGYGRRMTGRQNPDGTIAFFVENYLVRAGPDYTYSSVNLDAAVVRDTRWLLGINAIEFSPGPAGGVSFAKFYNFNGTTGARQTAIDMDGRGVKGMPGPCITCHGGRGDPLTPVDPAVGRPRFPLVPNSASVARGDVQAHLHGFSVDTFDFSTTAGLTRANQEAMLKQFNQWVLCSYPRVGAAAFPEDVCRRTAIASEWVGTAADVIKQAYGGNGMPSATFSGAFVPTAWATAGQTSLYQNVMVPACRTCHELRGTQYQSDIDFDTFAKFQSYSERIKHHVLDIGNMPLAKIVSDTFFASPGLDALANFLTAQGETSRSGTGAVLRPGRPVTRLVDRVIKQGPTTLSAPSTRFATTYAWSVISGPNGAVPPNSFTLTNATSAQPTFNASANGTYVVQLIVSSGATQSAAATANIVVNNALAIAPAAIRFVDIKSVLQARCTTCHQPGGNPLPPIFYTNIDRDGNGTVGDAVDDVWFYNEVRGRINITDPDASPLLRKPSNNHHNGGLLMNFDTSLTVGAAGRADYDLFLNWILNNAPQ